MHEFGAGGKVGLENIIQAFQSREMSGISGFESQSLVYQISDLIIQEDELLAINSVNSDGAIIKARLNAISSLGGRLVFSGFDNLIFENNLIMIDSWLPQILAELLRLMYLTSIARLSQLTNELERLNPMGYSDNSVHILYKHKIRRFLFDCVAGMRSSVVWTAQCEGNFMIIRSTVEDWLFKRSWLETVESNDHHLGRVILENGIPFIRLNLKIRVDSTFDELGLTTS